MKATLIRIALISTAMLMVNPPGACAAESSGAGRDKFGGLPVQVARPTGFFHVAKVGDRWVVVTPDGHPMWLLAVFSVGPMDGGITYRNHAEEKYCGGRKPCNVQSILARQAVLRLRAWGFNTLGELHSAYVQPVPLQNHANDEKMPFLHLVGPSLPGVRDGRVKNILEGVEVGPCCYVGYHGILVDPFDPAFESLVDERLDNFIRNSGGEMPHTPWLVGITMDDADVIFGIKRADNTHAGWLVAATAPRQARTFRKKRNVEYSDPTVYAKLAWRDYLKAKYKGDIGRLNAAWGSDYAGWGSTTKPYAGVDLGGGEGMTSLTLAIRSIPIVAGTVHIEIKGLSVRANDDGRGNLVGSGVRTGSTVDYKSGSIVLNTDSPVGEDQHVIASYTADGWPKHLSGGNGLLDEDGSSPWLRPSGLPPDFKSLEGVKSTVKSDLDGFLAGVDTSSLANKYFSVTASRAKAKFPNHMVINAAPLNVDLLDRAGGAVLKAAAQYFDLLQLSVRPDTVKRLSAALEVVRKPTYVYFIVTANEDSPLTGFRRPKDNDFPSQAERGKVYADVLNQVFQARSSDGVHYAVGLDFWEWTDKTTGGEKANFGLVTNRDNAYDGKEDVVARGKDAWGYPTGGEERNYGDFISYVRRANLGSADRLLEEIQRAQSTPAKAGSPR